MIFIDSSVIIAYKNRDDENHEKASAIMKDIIDFKYGKSIISNLVFSEIVTVIKLRKDLESAIELGEILKDSKEIDLVFLDEKLFENSWNIFRSRKGLSFVDASNLAIMTSLRIKKIATFDKDFKDIEGIEIIEK